MYNKLKADVLFLRGEHKQAREMFYEGAREGDEIASFNYGYCLWRGIGGEYDPKEAKSFFAFSQNMSGGEACYNLSMLYMHGEGVTKNMKLALKYMQMSAENGCVEAQLYMGMAHSTGYMLEPDIVGISMIPYHKPMYSDRVYLAGNVEEDKEEDERFTLVRADARTAFYWFGKAAHHDPTYVEELVAKGQFLYAKCFLEGMGTDINRDKGTKIMFIAGKSGSGEAVNFLRENGITAQMIKSESDYLLNKARKKHE